MQDSFAMTLSVLSTDSLADNEHKVERGGSSWPRDGSKGRRQPPIASAMAAAACGTAAANSEKRRKRRNRSPEFGASRGH